MSTKKGIEKVKSNYAHNLMNSSHNYVDFKAYFRIYVNKNRADRLLLQRK